MAKFLLWNVQRKPLDGLVQSLVRELSIDVVLLVEYAFGTSQLPRLLLPDGLFRRPSSNRFGVFAPASHSLSLLRTCGYRLGDRAGLWRWVPPSRQEGLIALVHGFDRRNYDDGARRVFLRRVADAVRLHEGARKHRRTVVAGDFNAHPFDPSVIDSDGLHAVGVRSVLGKTSRNVGGTGAVDFFYNPMWRVYGHGGHHADAGAATHHWRGGGVGELCWHMLDQVVMRPGEVARFPEDRLRIVTEVGGVSLLTPAGLPDPRSASDHLPVVFEWQL